MANSKKKWVAFKGNEIVPAAMVGEEKDQKVQAGEPVHVPAFYADSVVQDGVAEFCEPAKKKAALKKPVEPTAEEKAQQAVTAAQAALDTAEGTEDADAARADLLAAQKGLADLQG